MQKLFSQLFTRSRSTSSKRSNYRSSQTSINEDTSRQSAASSSMKMRGAASEGNLTLYNVDGKKMEKYKLHKASYRGDLDKVKGLTKPDVIDRPDQQRRTALHYAIDRGNLQIVAHLLHEGARLDVVDDDGRTPLVKAVITAPSNPNTPQLCALLLNQGADSFINGVDRYGRNALHYAVMVENDALLVMFLRCPKCDPDFPDGEGNTPLHVAVRKNSVGIVTLLVSNPDGAQANPNIPDRNGNTPLHWAATLGYVQVVTALLQSDGEYSCDPTLVNVNQMTAAEFARANQQENCARLIEQYARGAGHSAQSPPSTASKPLAQATMQNRPAMNDPAGRLDADQVDSDNDSDTSSSTSTASSGQIEISTDRWPGRPIPPATSENKSLADLIKDNPLQPTRPTNGGSSILGSLMTSIPLQPGTSASFNQAASDLSTRSPPMTSRPNDGQRPAMASAVERSLVNANPLVGPDPNASPKKTVTINHLVTSLHQTERSDSLSQSSSQDRTPIVSPHNQSIKPAQRYEESTSQSSTTSDTHSDDDSESRRDAMRSAPPPPAVFQQTQPFPLLNGTTMFTPSHMQQDPMMASKSDDEDSIEKLVADIYRQPASTGVESLVNRNVALATKPAQPMVSPREEESSWSTSSIAANHGPANSGVGIRALVQQQPLTVRKSADSTWDDSRPLSADLKKTTIQQEQAAAGSTSSDDSDDDSDHFRPGLSSSSGIKSLLTGTMRPIGPDTTTNSTPPITGFSNNRPAPATTSSNGALSSLVMTNIRPTGPEVTGSPIGASSGMINARPTTSTMPSNSSLSNLVMTHIQPTGPDVPTVPTSMNSGVHPIRPTAPANATISSLVNPSLRPMGSETDSSGVDHLTRMVEEIMRAPPTKQKPATSPGMMRNDRGIETLTISPLLRRGDSTASSNASSFIEETVRTTTDHHQGSSVGKQRYTINDDEEDWRTINNDGRDLKLLQTKYTTEMVSSNSRNFIRTSMHRDVNGLRGSMSSSTSSLQNNMERLNEIRDDLKQIERKQEDQFELKRQLKEMEIKKNNFEALYKKHDELLRSTEAKLEKETNEKQRLEWTTKTLNMELKSIKERLQTLEVEKTVLDQRCLKLKEERDNFDERLRVLQNTSLASTNTTLLREEDIEKIKTRHREELKLLSAENDELHQRTKQLQSDLQLHKESLDVTIRYKIDLEKALEEKTLLQVELDQLRHERDMLEKDRLEYKAKYDSLQEEIRVMLAERSKLEQKLTTELQEQIKQRQRSTDDVKKYKTQIEQLNMKLGDAEARLLVLQTQNEALLASKDREIKTEFENLTQRLNQIESEKFNAEQRYQNEHKEILTKQQQPQQHMLHEPLVILTSTPLSNGVQSHQQHSPSMPCVKCDTLQRSFEHEREHRLQVERDNNRLREVVERQKQHQDELNRSLQEEHQRNDQSKEMRAETERMRQELERVRQELSRLVMNYEPGHNLSQQHAQMHSQIENMRHIHQQDYGHRRRTSSNENKPLLIMANGYHPTTSPHRHDHSSTYPCSVCSNSRLLKERLENAIDTSLAEQRIQTLKQFPVLPRHNSPVTTAHLNGNSSGVDYLRKRYYL